MLNELTPVRFIALTLTEGWTKPSAGTEWKSIKSLCYKIYQPCQLDFKAVQSSKRELYIKQLPKHFTLAVWDQPKPWGSHWGNQAATRGWWFLLAKLTLHLSMLRKSHHMHIWFLLPCYLACFGWVDTATLDFGQGFTLKEVWEEPEGKGVSAAWSGAWDHVKELDEDSVGSCPLQQERRNHRKEVFWKKYLTAIWAES